MTSTKEVVPPRGRDAVKEALLDAAAELFAAHGSRAVSVRDVAARAGVNHGLVHRHFGSKDALRQAVMDRLTEQIAKAAEGAKLRLGELPRAFSATAALGKYWRMLARALLDGDDIHALQERFPVVDQLLRQLGEAKQEGALDADIDVRVLAASSVALALGWLLFEPFVLAAAGLEGEPDVRQRVFDHWLRAVLR